MKLFPTPDETIETLSRRIKAREQSCAEVVADCLRRIDELEPMLHAWVLVDREGARRRAGELDADLAAGRWHGPLHGIPVGIKDIVDVAGFPTAAGSARLAQQIAPRDAELVAALRAAGAILLGKTVTTQYASFDPPVTRNPWNPERTPGGSSSGSAAAVAAGMCLGAIGSQTGGSITRPASYCGIPGCKATFGRVSAAGVMPLAPSLDHPGPMARSVQDLALLLDAISNTPTRQAESIAKTLRERSTRAPSLGRLAGLFQERAEDVVGAEMARVVGVLQSAGARVADATLPTEFDEVLPRHRTIMVAEAAANHGEAYRAHRDEFLPKISELIEEGLATTAAEYIRCREHQARLSQAMLGCFEGVDALLVPATTDSAPDRSTTGDPAFNSPWSYTRLPTVSIPTGLAPDGMPLAIQLVGRPHSEPALFRVAAWCEEVVQSVG